VTTVCRTLSVEDAGKILGYSRNSAYEAAKSGELPTIRLGRKLRVPRAALEKMLGEAIDAAAAP
jgi:excisionase family DNA binding protein